MLFQTTFSLELLESKLMMNHLQMTVSNRVFGSLRIYIEDKIMDRRSIHLHQANATVN